MKDRNWIAKAQMQGLKPVTFEHTAWDLAIATQSLADIEQPLAFEIARVYGAQQVYTGLTTIRGWCPTANASCR